MKIISNPPIIIKNKIYENQAFCIIILIVIDVIRVCTNKISPIEIGWFRNINVSLILIINNINIVMQKIV
jgi:hypothetical protein